MTKGTQARQAYSLARLGHTYKYIADIFGVSPQVIHAKVKKQELKFGALPERKAGFKKGTKTKLQKRHQKSEVLK